MAAKQVFPMTNKFTQNNGNSVGICTCVSLRWAKKTLDAGRGLRAYSDLGVDDHTMNAQMHQLRRLDDQPAAQCELVGLVPVGADLVVASADDVARRAATTAPHVAIFWTRTHTMGYRYAHGEKEFFDVEVGLFRAKKTKDIVSKMKQVTRDYGPILGMRIVGVPR